MGLLLLRGMAMGAFHVVPVSEDFKYQTRFINFHPWKGMQACETPERYRWGKPPRTYRGLRKIWVVEDLFRKSRTEVTVAEVIRSPIPELGLVRKERPNPDAGLDGGTDAGKKGRGCGCRVPDSRHGGSGAASLLALVAAAVIGNRRRRR